MDPDDELMVAYGEGDPSAFAALYDRHANAVYSFCVRRLGDRAAAEDVLQDTFRRLVEVRERYEPRGRFRSYIFTLARNACIDHLRSQREEKRLSRLREQGLQVEDTGSSPAARLETEEEVGRLLDLLNDGQREVLLLAKYHGFPYRKIADMIGSTEAAVKQKVYRALERVRAALEDEA